MRAPNWYKDKQVVILGLARSGVAVAKLFQECGAAVTVNDQKKREECPEADELEALGISVVCGGHPPELIHEEVALVVKNPGIPYKAEPVARAASFGIEIVTEVEVASHISQAPMIGITGSNGKTTTTTWIGRMLEQAGMKPIVAGNIGRALCDAAMEADADNWLVVELSSFQLKGTTDFRPRVACLLNVYETHLDYHGTMEDYAGSKAKLFASQEAGDIAVLNWDDAYCRSLIPSLHAKVVPFSMKEELESGVYLSLLPAAAADGSTVEKRHIVWKQEGRGPVAVLPTEELGIPGEFNVENALAAVAAALSAGASVEAVARALREFRGVEHRLEYVREKDGVVYYNNSKATNPAATIKALEAFEQPIVLVAGGLDRGMEYTDLLPYFRERVKAVVALGETRQKIARVAEEAGLSLVKTVDTANNPAAAVAEAVEAAHAFAEAGDVVLLSPACASWDMFASYEVRGSMFKESVHNL
ncbi:UDP-N-acetylmuramoyl-L-alanine--D-glutamate ligase [Gorillibacterium sp. sgz5001074]|uniref:UDP-N-acetylmuramoyl-L-alanine--D-glutamate ligase n=1 Tax=Gorillibacterium sp. sgz5001074 TaxID=3446695 RepID=UPI003F66EB1C